MFSINFAGKPVNRPGKYTWIILGFIILAAAFLRFYNLDEESFWNDELATQQTASQKNAAGIIDFLEVEDVHPPLYYFLVHFIDNNIGDSEFLYRLPSVIFGIFAVWGVFLIGRKLYSDTEALIASAFMAVMHMPLYFSREARFYSMLLCLVIFSVYFYLGLLEGIKTGRPKIRDVILYILTAILASYTHYFGLLFVFIQGVYLVIYSLKIKRSVKLVMVIYLVLLLLFLPNLPLMYRQTQYGSIYINAPGIIFPAKLLYHLFGPSYIITIVLTLPVLIYLVRQLQKKKLFRDKNSLTFNPDLFILLWIISPIAAGYIISYILNPVLEPKNMIIIMPAVYLLLARSVTGLAKNAMLQAAVALVLTAGILWYLLVIYNYYGEPHKEQFREAAAFAAENSGGRTLPVIAFTWKKSYLDYYFKKYETDLKTDTIFGEAADTNKAMRYIKSAPGAYFWYITGHRKPDSAFVRFLDVHYDPEKRRLFFGASATLYRK